MKSGKCNACAYFISCPFLLFSCSALRRRLSILKLKLRNKRCRSWRECCSSLLVVNGIESGSRTRLLLQLVCLKRLEVNAIPVFCIAVLTAKTKNNTAQGRKERYRNTNSSL